MKIAIPTANGELCMHFGHCDQFAMVEVDETSKEVTGTEFLTPPAHEPGVLPQWLSEQKANVIVAGGMGQRAQQIFVQFGVKVVVGAEGTDPKEIAINYVNGSLPCGTNLCDH